MENKVVGAILGAVQVVAAGIRGGRSSEPAPQGTQRLCPTPAAGAERIARDLGPVPRKGSGQPGAMHPAAPCLSLSCRLTGGQVTLQKRMAEQGDIALRNQTRSTGGLERTGEAAEREGRRRATACSSAVLDGPAPTSARASTPAWHAHEFRN